MKKIKLILPLLLLIAFMSSCQDDLVESNYGPISDPLLWTGPKDLEQTLNSSVNYIDATWAYHTMFFMLMEDGATDYWVGGANNAGQFGNFSEWRTSYPNVFGWGLWPAMWRSIYYSNLVLDRMKRVPGLTDAEKAKFEGQARFYRAFNYYFAQNKFGGVAIVLSPEDKRTEIPQSPRDSVRMLVENDLIVASKLLLNKAAVDAESQPSRPSKQAAFGLLARLYINWETKADRWKKTSDACDSVISYSGLGLESPYSKIFSLTNENNKEIVYALKHDASFASGVFLFNDYFARPGDMKIPSSSQYSWGDWSVTIGFYNSFDPNDDRRKQLLNIYTRKDDSTAVSTYPIVVKYPLDPSTNGWAGSNDQPLIRFADIILMKAEAQNELGNLSVAIGLVNQIRHRAGLGDVSASASSSKDALREHIYLERRWEFFDEGLGRTDMIRFGKFLPWVASKTGKAADSKYLVYPFDGDALSKNKGLVQNTGYLN
jgi:starch-binding outer membrane protein, SusD/RagB family